MNHMMLGGLGRSRVPAAGGGGPTFTPVATSDFTGTAGNLPTGFTDLDLFAGAVQIASGGATFHNVTGAFSTASRNGTFSNDQYAQVVVSGMGFGTNGDSIGVIVRASANTAPNEDHYFAEVIDQATPVLSWGVTTNGTRTFFNQNSTATTWANGDTIRLYCLGTTIAVQKNGTTVHSTTNATYGTGQPGILAHVGFNDSMRGDNGEFGDVT